jgi:hypothetical protein
MTWDIFAALIAIVVACITFAGAMHVIKSETVSAARHIDKVLDDFDLIDISDTKNGGEALERMAREMRGRRPDGQH